MFPTMRHRLIIAACSVVGGLAWLSVKQPLSAADGSSGISLMSAQIGPILAWPLAVAAGLPALVLGVVTSVSGHLLSGVFVGSVALGVLAACGGSIAGWQQRMDTGNALPGAYGGLIVEMLMWQVGLVCMLAVVQILRSPVRTRVPALAFGDHLGEETRLFIPGAQSLCAGLLCAAVGAVVGSLLLQSHDTAQVVTGLFIAFTVGALVGHLFFPHANPVGILFSPTLVALVVYGYVLVKFDSRQQVLSAWRDTTLPSWQHMPALAFGLPIHYASAAVAGATVGVGWAQAILMGNRQSKAPAGTLVDAGATDHGGNIAKSGKWRR